jgi:sec-independent protein translocase protein TatA
MFGMSAEHIIILGVVLLIFGPRRLPELGNTLGKAMRNFKDAISGVEEAKFRRINENPPPAGQTSTNTASAAGSTPEPEKKPESTGTDGSGPAKT